jgi:hypothetical protein
MITKSQGLRLKSLPWVMYSIAFWPLSKASPYNRLVALTYNLSRQVITSRWAWNIGKVERVCTVSGSYWLHQVPRLFWGALLLLTMHNANASAAAFASSPGTLAESYSLIIAHIGCLSTNGIIFTSTSYLYKTWDSNYGLAMMSISTCPSRPRSKPNLRKYWRLSIQIVNMSSKWPMPRTI